MDYYYSDDIKEEVALFSKFNVSASITSIKLIKPFKFTKISLFYGKKVYPWYPWYPWSKFSVSLGPVHPKIAAISSCR